MFVDPSKPFAATIEADEFNQLWPEFTFLFRPPVEFEITEAMGAPGGQLQLMRDKIIAWKGLKADAEAAAYLNKNFGAQMKRQIMVGDDIPYHADLLSTLHSVCLTQMWRKMAGFLPLGTGSTETTQSRQETITKN